jgi:hypothetical protein
MRRLRSSHARRQVGPDMKRPGRGAVPTSTRALVCQGNDAHLGCRRLRRIDNPASVTHAIRHGLPAGFCYGCQPSPIAPLILWNDRSSDLQLSGDAVPARPDVRHGVLQQSDNTIEQTQPIRPCL